MQGNLLPLFVGNPTLVPAGVELASVFFCSAFQLVVGFQCVSVSPQRMEGSGTFGHFEFFASALDQHWVEGGSLSQLEVEKMQERMFAACL